jgi:PRA1 family protein 1
MRMWEQSGIFEEIDSDEDDDQGVQLGDALHFTGADIGRRPRRAYNYSDESDEDDDSAPEDHGMQVALRHKEDSLVQRAMIRIRRAQEMGKEDVALPVQERDALERKIESDRAKGRKPLLAIGSSSSTSGKKTSEKSRPSSKASSRSRSGKKSARSSGTQLDQLPPNPPGYMVPGPDGQLVFAPIGPYPPPGVDRPLSSQNVSQRGARRWVSGPEVASASHGYMAPGPRPLPDDPNWQPRQRAYSSQALPVPYPIGYGHPYPPPAIPHKYRQGDPRVSDPYGNPRASDPGLMPRGHHRRRRPERTPSESEESSGSSDDGAGVEVDVVPDDEGKGYEIVSASSRTSVHSTATTSSAAARSSGGKGRTKRR